METAKNQDQTKEVRVEDITMGRTVLGFIKIRILGLPDPLYERIVLLKKLKKILKKLDIKGINFSKQRLTKEFGEYLFDIYRYYYPLKNIIDFSKPKNVRNFIEFLINSVASDKQKETLNQLLSEDFIKESLVSMGGKNSSAKIKDMYKEFHNSFTKEQLKKINFVFSLGSSLYECLKFDFYVLLKKFCPELKEENVTSPPAFREVDVEQVEVMIKDMTDHFYMLNMEANYYEFIDAYGKFLGRDIIPQEDFQKFMKLITKLVKTNYLMLMVQYITGDVFFRPFYSFSEKNAFSEYMKEIVNLINSMQTKIAGAIRVEKLDKTLKELFGSSNFLELTGYTPEQNDYLVRNNAGGFVYVDSLNVLKKFMLDVYNRYLRKNLHSFILKATFVSQHFQENMNSYYYNCNSIIDQILAFEEKMKGKEGWDRISGLIKGRGKDSSLSHLAKKYVNEFNEEAREILNKALNTFEQLKENLREIIESYNKGQKDPVTNIKTFAGTGTVDIVKNLAHAFNDLSKVLAYFKMVIKE